MRKIVKIFALIFIVSIAFNAHNFTPPLWKNVQSSAFVMNGYLTLAAGLDTTPGKGAGFIYSQDSNDEVKDLNRQIQLKKEEAKKIKARQEKYAQTLKEKQREKISLIGQLAILDNHLAKSELDIEKVQTDISITDLEIKKIDAEIKEINEQTVEEKDHLASILRLLYKQDQASALEIILLNDNLSEFLNQIKYIEDINGAIGKSLDILKANKEQSEKKLASLDEKNKELNGLKNELEDKKIALEDEQESKGFILEQTRSSEKEYQRLLQLARQEQEQAAADISGLEKTVRDKISRISERKLEFNDAGLTWPVPKNIITAYFHDPDYPFRFIFEHPAIDIKAGQGTQVKAAASGYVARAKDAGKGYSYIMLIHGDGLATVYGHVSKIYVEEEEYVVQGQTIGLSGGLPGTSGAGRLTTGPHLHFEVRLNGIPVNPSEYLP